MVLMKMIDVLQYELDEQMQKGYTESAAGNAIAASTTWMELWKMIKKAMDTHDIAYIEDMNHAFQRLQNIPNWAMDFEIELYKASKERKHFLQQRIDFCGEYNMRSIDEDNLSNLVRKRVIAESYFLLGEPEEGERRFQAYVSQYPTDNWGWINWSDQYGVFALEENRDHEKAIAILEMGLEVSELDDRADIYERLEDLYKEEGMEEAARETGKEAQQQVEKNQVHNKLAMHHTLSQAEKKVTAVSAIGRGKIGRNEPCPCGSGKKYKKCCWK